MESQAIDRIKPGGMEMFCCVVINTLVCGNWASLSEPHTCEAVCLHIHVHCIICVLYDRVSYRRYILTSANTIVSR